MMAKRSAGVFQAPSSQKRPRLSDASSETSNGPAAELAADFRDFLKDLTINDRVQINTLTLIAKDNTEYALTLSDELLKHIRSVAPQRKLPALFVLDSIVKNVGTPYTIYLSRNLYKTFMDAFILVDNNTRKQMQSMLNTWKVPIPGSMDQKPVFPHEITRTIENALIRANMVSIEQKNHNVPGLQPQPNHALPPRPSVTPQFDQWRSSPAPSPAYAHAPQYPPPPQQQPYQQQYGVSPAEFQYGLPSSTYAQHQSPAPPYENSHYQPPHAMSPAPGYGSVYQPPPPTQFQPTYPPPPIRSPQPNYQTPYQPPPQHQYQQPYQPPPSVVQSPPFQPPYNPTPQPNQWSLTALLQASGTHTGAPQPAPYPQPPPNLSNPSQFPGLNGLYPPALNGTPTMKPATPQPAHHLIPQPQNFATPPKPLSSLSSSKLNSAHFANDAKLTAASIKTPRPGLLSTLYPSLPASQCTTCGRRFATDCEAGKQRKTRHLDSHFRTNMRLTSALELRGAGASRSWYIDEVEWISYREVDDADAAEDRTADVDGAPDGSTGNGPAAGKKAKAAEKYITAPSDAALRKQVCPICQEEFKAEYHEVDQEWVFMDALKVPPVGADAKIYHASCLEEMAKDRDGA